MELYKVRYCFTNLDAEITDGEWHIDTLDNNGEEFNYEEAVHTVRELGFREGVKWANMIKIVDPEDDPEPDSDWDDEEHYTPSATRGDYSPSCPWNAPGMSISDFI